MPASKFIHPFVPIIIVDDAKAHVPDPLPKGIAIRLVATTPQKLSRQLNSSALRFVLSQVNRIFWLDEGVPLIVAFSVKDVVLTPG